VVARVAILELVRHLGRCRLTARTKTAPAVGRVAINMRPASSSWGGGSEWARQSARFLGQRGYAVDFHLEGQPDCIILADPSVGGLVEFGPDEIEAHKRRFPHVYCLHRVNENDQRKGTHHVDRLLAEANRVADHTVFVSAWLRDYHCQRWFDRSRPHSVIVNGADPAIYHPVGSAALAPGGTMRVVTHHWSDNWNKGFAVYEEIDRLLADKIVQGMEFWVIGRWPKEIRWRVTRTFEPVHGAGLAALLRSCHVYVTASVWEPGPMHVVEGLQCGLPVLYHANGGGIVEVARPFGVPFGDDVRSALLEIRERYGALRAAVLKSSPSGDEMALAYARLIQQGIVRRQAT